MKIHADQIRTLSPNQKLTCPLPKGLGRIELTTSLSNKDHWSLIVTIFNDLANEKTEQILEGDDFYRHYIGYFALPEDEKRYPGVNLYKTFKDKAANVLPDTVLIWFQHRPQTMEICTSSDADIS